MPVNVRRGKSKYEYRTPGGKVLALCPLDAKQSEVWAAYEQAVSQSAPTVDNLARAYFESREFCRRRPKTQAGYRASWKTLEPVWAGVDATRVRPVHIRNYMDERGKSAEVAANREYSLLRNIFAWAFERSKVKLNPCLGVKKFPETPREKYVEDYEYHPYLELSRPVAQVFMEIAYLCGSRGQDVRMITMPDLREEGIYICQGKTGKKQIKKWTPRLRDAVELAKQLRAEILQHKPGIISPYLIIARSASPYTESGLKSLWAKNRDQVRKKMAATAGVKPEDIKFDWTYHDLKAKGISDFDGDKQKFSGHKSYSQVQDYDRKTQLAPTLETDARPLRR